ncbi:ubiquinone biosynthesis protein COQ4 homolog, mitochondrial [Parasteatoda tepidariorum]|uniref:ubiquinone biosynthesis protein COQ4 homolog, mitochondrial n=1 Tax=Parasteatoda tepidariorum TaxID=114398 RepID=UPI001C725D85|nr:ubiquinone biosynthesis protein COQ4 homolog, mitochondrial-like [Parasteatoda tepidariorum]
MMRFGFGRSAHLVQIAKFSTQSNKFSAEKEINQVLYERGQQLYDTHIPTSFIQKCLLVFGSSIMSISDVYRHDMIAVLGETTGVSAAKKIREKMLNDPEGKSILDERPRINSATLDYDYLRSLSPNTLGRTYLAFLENHHVTPDSRREVTFVDDDSISYVIQRYREVHDLNHAILGMPTNMLGEVAIKWVEAMQTGFPMCISAAVIGPVRFKPKQRQKYVKSYLPWAIECGHKAKFLMNIYYEKRWDQDLLDLKEELNIPEFNSESD